MKILLSFFVLFSFGISYTQNYFPLEKGFAWHYNKTLYNKNSANGTFKTSSSVMFKEVLVNSALVPQKHFNNRKRNYISNCEILNPDDKIKIRSYENGDTNKVLLETYYLDSLEYVIYFDETSYFKFDSIYGLVEENSQYFDPDLIMDFSRPIGDTLVQNGHVFSFNLDYLSGEQINYHWYYKVTSIIKNTEDIIVNNINYINCYHTVTKWELFWGRKDLGPDNLKPEGEKFDEWITYAWYAPDIGLVKRYSEGKGDIVLVKSSTSIEINRSLLSKSFKLYNNYPNPFNSETIIQFYLPSKLPVVLSIYDSRGRKLQTLLNRTLSKGYHLVKFSGNSVSSGLYFYVVIAGKNHDYGKMLLIK